LKRNYISRIFLHAGAIFFLLSSCLWSQASKNNKEGRHYLKLFEGWEFCLAEPLKDKENPLLQLSQAVEQQWYSYEEIESTDIKDNQELWLRIPLPSVNWADSYFFLEQNKAVTFTVFLDREEIYSNRDTGGDILIKDQGKQYHKIMLPAGLQDKTLYLHLNPPELSSLSFKNSMLISGMTPWEALSDQLQDRLRLNIFEFIQGIIIFIAGIAALVFFLFLLKPRDRAVLYFALFTFLYGLRILADTYWTGYLYENIQFLRYLSASITYMIPIPLTLFFKQFINWGWKSSLLWLLIFQIIYALSAILTDLLVGIPSTAREPFNGIMVILGIFLVVANLLKSRLRRSTEIKALKVLLIIWTIPAINENLVGLGLLPWQVRMERPAFFIFICCLGFVVAYRVVSKQKYLQQQLMQADKMIALGTLVSGVAHEISNPNNYILLNSEILSRAWRDINPIIEQHNKKNKDFLLAGVPYSEAKKNIPQFISDIHQGAGRIENIVKNLKDYAHPIQQDQMEKIDVNAVIQSAINLIENQIRKLTNKFSVEYNHSLPPIRGNFQRLEQVIINLLLNSSQALSDKSKGISVSTGYQRNSEYIQIQVKDEGEGISSANLTQITNPFFTTRRDSGGLGLGLSICSTIIKDHGGELQFDSKPRKGTTATITLPIFLD